MGHATIADVETLLAPATLGALEGRRMRMVRTRPFATADSASGNVFVAVETEGVAGEAAGRYLVKRLSAARDWLMRATADLGREPLLWLSGALDRLGDGARHAIVAVARDEPPRSSPHPATGRGLSPRNEEGQPVAWALLLRDVSAGLLPPRFEPLAPETHAATLKGIAALHATCFEDAATLALPFLCAPERYFTALAPATGVRELEATPVAARIVRGWELFDGLVPPDVAEVVRALHADPAPLCQALGRHRQTLLHGDLRRANLALERDARTGEPALVLLDWQLATVGPPAADLAWYLADALRLPQPKEETLAAYRRALERRLGAPYDDAEWEATVALGLLGGLLRFGWLLAAFAARHADAGLRAHYRGELGWWGERAREGARRV